MIASRLERLERSHAATVADLHERRRLAGIELDARAHDACAAGLHDCLLLHGRQRSRRIDAQPLHPRGIEQFPK